MLQCWGLVSLGVAAPRQWPSMEKTQCVQDGASLFGIPAALGSCVCRSVPQFPQG